MEHRYKMTHYYELGNNISYKKYDRMKIKQALKEYNTTITSLNKISKKYDIPISVLQECNAFDMMNQSGQKPLSPKIEAYLMDLLNKCFESGYPIHRIDLRTVVKVYLDRLGCNIKRFNNNLPGPIFIKNFLRRYKKKMNVDLVQEPFMVKTVLPAGVIEKYFKDMEITMGAPLSSILKDEFPYEEDNRTIKKSIVWNYFTKKSPGLATCRACNNDYSYKSTVSNLRKHWVHKHGKLNDIDCESDQDFCRPKERIVKTERYFDFNDDEKLARCKICFKEIQSDSVADLVKHVVGEHDDYDDFTDAETSDTECDKSGASQVKKNIEKEHLQDSHSDDKSQRIIISADGELYEIETKQDKENEDDGQNDPIQMDTVYLEDYGDMPIKSKRSLKRPSYKQAKRDSIQQNKKYKFNQLTNVDSSSDDDRIFKNKHIKKKENTRIDIFGQYLVTLLKELPKRLSDELQADMIKQVITAKISYESQSNSDISVTNKSQDTDVTVNACNSEANGVNCYDK